MKKLKRPEAKKSEILFWVSNNGWWVEAAACVGVGLVRIARRGKALRNYRRLEVNEILSMHLKNSSKLDCNVYEIKDVLIKRFHPS